ncbi:MAG: hypothetical protein Q8P60_12225 [Pseudorhodobacter sp.]|nr:hypothetical protein [Pseudorhodobacter sp.]
MLYNLRHRLSGLILTSALLIATVATGFAQHAPASPDDSARLSYVLIWGLTAADLCTEPGAAGKAVAMANCAACHLVAAVVLPDPVLAPVAVDLRGAVAVLPVLPVRRLVALDLARLARAPPLA